MTESPHHSIYAFGLALAVALAACSAQLQGSPDAGEDLGASAADAGADELDAGELDASTADDAGLELDAGAAGDMGPAPASCDRRSLVCSDAAECCPNRAGEATCEPLGGGFGQCVAPCSSSADCWPGWCCFDDPTTMRRCVPDFTCSGGTP